MNQESISLEFCQQRWSQCYQVNSGWTVPQFPSNHQNTPLHSNPIIQQPIVVHLTLSFSQCDPPNYPLKSPTLLFLLCVSILFLLLLFSGCCWSTRSRLQRQQSFFICGDFPVLSYFQGKRRRQKCENAAKRKLNSKSKKDPQEFLDVVWSQRGWTITRRKDKHTILTRSSFYISNLRVPKRLGLGGSPKLLMYLQP